MRRQTTITKSETTILHTPYFHRLWRDRFATPRHSATLSRKTILAPTQANECRNDSHPLDPSNRIRRRRFSRDRCPRYLLKELISYRSFNDERVCFVQPIPISPVMSRREIWSEARSCDMGELSRSWRDWQQWGVHSGVGAAVAATARMLAMMIEERIVIFRNLDI